MVMTVDHSKRALRAENYITWLHKQTT